MNNSQTILDFWFKEIDSSLWWQKNAEFDELIRQRFAKTHQQATRGELAHWRTDAHGRLAEIIVLDQFSRNLYRDQAQAFAYDLAALVLAQQTVSLALDKSLTSLEKAFLYLPFMHSESAIIHQQAVELYSQTGLEFNLSFEFKHKAIIDRFGRYPHRNAILGRDSTPAELLFLQQPNSSF